MRHQYSLAHLTVMGCAPPEMTRIAAAAGYDFVSFRLIPMGLAGEPRYLPGDAGMIRETKAALRQTGLSVLDLELASIVEDVEPEVHSLLVATEESLHAGVAQCREGNRMGDVSSAIQRVVEGAGFSVVRSLVGHGVGRSMHEDPQVPNYGKAGKGVQLEQGMVLAIEPMTTAGRPGVRVGGDGWAIFSQDGSAAAHFEFTVAITAAGPLILTPWHLPADARTGAPSAAESVAEGIATAG